MRHFLFYSTLEPRKAFEDLSKLDVSLFNVNAHMPGSFPDRPPEETRLTIGVHDKGRLSPAPRTQVEVIYSPEKCPRYREGLQQVYDILKNPRIFDLLSKEHSLQDLLA